MTQITSCQPPKALPLFMAPLTKCLQTDLQSKGIFNLSPPGLEYLISHKTLPTLVTCSQICFLLLGPMTTGLYVRPYPKVKADLNEFLPSSPLSLPSRLSRKKKKKKNADSTHFAASQNKSSPLADLQRLNSLHLHSQPHGFTWALHSELC